MPKESGNWIPVPVEQVTREQIAKLRAEIEQEKQAIDAERQQLEEEAEYYEPGQEPGCHRRDETRKATK